MYLRQFAMTNWNKLKLRSPASNRRREKLFKALTMLSDRVFPNQLKLRSIRKLAVLQEKQNLNYPKSNCQQNNSIAITRSNPRFCTIFDKLASRCNLQRSVSGTVEGGTRFAPCHLTAAPPQRLPWKVKVAFLQKRRPVQPENLAALPDAEGNSEGQLPPNCTGSVTANRRF